MGRAVQGMLCLRGVELVLLSPASGWLLSSPKPVSPCPAVLGLRCAGLTRAPLLGRPLSFPEPVEKVSLGHLLSAWGTAQGEGELGGCPA